MRGFYATLDRDTCKPYMEAMPVMLPMASWWARDIELKRPPTLPLAPSVVAIDTGSYVLAQQFSGGYPYGWTVESMTRWIAGVRPAADWAVLPDWPCEGKYDWEIRDIQVRGGFTIVHMLRERLGVPWVWCPVLQGLTVEDYLRHAVQLAGVIYALRDFYLERGQAQHYRVCLGSICRRGQTSTVRTIVEAIAAVLPEIPLHLFGVKLDVLTDWESLPETVYSCDSAAWNGRFGSDIPVITAEQRRLKMTQREYTIRVLLPSYRARAEQALTGRAAYAQRLFG